MVRGVLIKMIVELAADTWVKVKFKNGVNSSGSLGEFDEGQIAYAKRNVELPARDPSWWVTDPKTGYLLNVDEELMKSTLWTVREGGQPVLATPAILKRIASYFLSKVNQAKKLRKKMMDEEKVLPKTSKGPAAGSRSALKKVMVKRRK